MEPVDFLGLYGQDPVNDFQVGETMYIITGNSGQGMTGSAIGSMIVADQILGRPNPWSNVRFSYCPCQRQLLRHLVLGHHSALACTSRLSLQHGLRTLAILVPAKVGIVTVAAPPLCAITLDQPPPQRQVIRCLQAISPLLPS
jgi:hypothetical protein